ncbi:MAG: tRNA glutamyl-Q(34) synthetase GluQRS [Verrucomicrobiaceae bacterium]|nr:MAG: tRNA glutamyl-Q(34) synthetase GluQRS [Verrucomicrobiaceae bacterium]
MRTRFAPSPTGRLHLGHVLAARVAWKLVRDAGGEFLLRHEDIDGSRVREEFYQGIEEDLQWLGLTWNGEALRQTDRIPAYDAALATLRERNLVYPCFCTRREIQDEWARMGAAPQGPEAPVYPGICRKLSTEERQEKMRAGIPFAWRLDAGKAAGITGPLSFRDLRFGEIPVDPELLGDVVLARKDIGTAYHLAVVVDDAFQEITHVTRGEDLLSSTHVHRLLQCLLGLPEPFYLHHGLMVDEDGKRLAKRNDPLAVATMREQGLSPAEVMEKLPEG